MWPLVQQSSAPKVGTTSTEAQAWSCLDLSATAGVFACPVNARFAPALNVYLWLTPLNIGRPGQWLSLL